MATEVDKHRASMLFSTLKPHEYLSFVSHHQESSQGEARVVREGIAVALGIPKESIFIDSTHLVDLRNLCDHAARARTMLLFQTKHTMFRPYILAEVFTALKSGTIVIPVYIERKGYDFSEVSKFLSSRNFAAEIDRRNRGASRVLQNQGIDLMEMGQVLNERIPTLVSKTFSLGWSDAVQETAIKEIAELVLARAEGVPPRPERAIFQKNIQPSERVVSCLSCEKTIVVPFGCNVFWCPGCGRLQRHPISQKAKAAEGAVGTSDKLSAERDLA